VLRDEGPSHLLRCWNPQAFSRIDELERAQDR